MNKAINSKKNSSLLIIDDDPEMSKLLGAMLRSEGFVIHQTYDGNSGIRMVYEIRPNLIILDVMMPTMNGIEVCKRLREMTNTPILMLTALSRDIDIVRGLSAGADDYVRKPFKKEELIARINALLRRNLDNVRSTTLRINQYNDEHLSINLETRRVTLNGKTIDLSSLEYKLLACLVRNINTTVSHRQILDEVWGKSYHDLASTVTLYVFYLRKKIEDAQHGHQYINTQWGKGYIFVPRSRE